MDWTHLKDWWKRQLIEDWKQAHKWLSVQLAALVAAAQLVYPNVQSLQSYIPPTMFHYLMIGMTLLIIVGRLKAQP